MGAISERDENVDASQVSTECGEGTASSPFVRRGRGKTDCRGMAMAEGGEAALELSAESDAAMQWERSTAPGVKRQARVKSYPMWTQAEREKGMARVFKL